MYNYSSWDLYLFIKQIRNLVNKLMNIKPKQETHTTSWERLNIHSDYTFEM